MGRLENRPVSKQQHGQQQQQIFQSWEQRIQSQHKNKTSICPLLGHKKLGYGSSLES